MKKDCEIDGCGHPAGLGFSQCHGHRAKNIAEPGPGPCGDPGCSPGMRVVYVAHPLGAGPDREANRRAAADWCGWIASTFGVAISADWIVLSGVWDETPENRLFGICCDLEMISRADEVWQVGPTLSPGMLMEGAHAQRLGKIVFNLTGMSRETIFDLLHWKIKK